MGTSANTFIPPNQSPLPTRVATIGPCQSASPTPSTTPFTCACENSAPASVVDSCTRIAQPFCSRHDPVALCCCQGAWVCDIDQGFGGPNGTNARSAAASVALSAVAAAASVMLLL